MPLTITVVTPSLNQGDFIEETVRSVLCQEGDFSIDYIIMDGGSTDDSLSVIKKYDSLLKAGAWPIKCRSISFRWRSEPDNGQTDAINRGFATASGQIFGWLNSDDRLLPGAFAKVTGVDWKRFGLCYGEGRWISREGTPIADYPTFRPNRYALYCKCTLCQPTVYFRKDTFIRLGELSLDYQLAFDYEYWLRAVFKGAKFRRIRQVLAESRMYHQNKSLTDPRASEWESWRLRERYYGKTTLSRTLLSLYSKIIVRRTDRQERRLFEVIGQAHS